MTIKFKTIKDIKSFTIDRSRWVRGDIGGESLLLNRQNNMCCLGHYSKACGISESDLKGEGGPTDTVGDKFLNKNQLGKAWLANFLQKDTEIIDWRSKLFKILKDEDNEFWADNTKIAENLMDINDNLYIGEKEREEEIKEEFAKIGVKVKFIN
jgi:hypothetical protein